MTDHANSHANSGSEHDGLRDQIANALWGSPTNGDARKAADVVMAVVQPALDERDAEVERLCGLLDELRRHPDAWCSHQHITMAAFGRVVAEKNDFRAQREEATLYARKMIAEREQAEAERDQLRYERRLLGFARMTLDLVASGDETRWPQARREAEDIAQRIVDEIGHPVTDEPALGPSLRAELKQAEAAIARVRAIPRLPHVSEQQGELGRAYTRGWQSVIDALDAALDESEETP